MRAIQEGKTAEAFWARSILKIYTTYSLQQLRVAGNHMQCLRWSKGFQHPSGCTSMPYVWHSAVLLFTCITKTWWRRGRRVRVSSSSKTYRTSFRAGAGGLHVFAVFVSVIVRAAKRLRQNFNYEHMHKCHQVQLLIGPFLSPALSTVSLGFHIQTLY